METSSQPLAASFTIPACNLPLFQERIAGLNKRAARLGVAGIVVTVVVAYVAKQYQTKQGNIWLAPDSPVPAGAELTGAVMPWHTVTVTGQSPKFDGWRFIATLEPIDAEGDALNLLQCVPGEVCPNEYRNRVGQCDHCCYKRNRKQTFVVRHDNGQHKMVGRQCLRDFLGHLDPHTVASWAELLVELGNIGDSAEDEGWSGGGYQESGYDLETVLAWTAAVVNEFGWVSRTAARYDDRAKATANIVSYLLARPWHNDGLREWEALRAQCQPTDEHKADASVAREWAIGFDDATIENNNYLANCNAVARANYAVSKTLGVACSILSSFQREQARLKMAALEAARVSVHVGKIGVRAVFTVTVLKVTPFDGAFGQCGIHKMIDDKGNDLVWFASGDGWLKVGETYKVKATPKKHDDFKGRPQTALNRVTVVK